MDQPSKGDAFRRRASVAFGVVCVALVGLVALAAWGGWNAWGWVGLLVCGGAAGIVAAAVGVGTFVIWVMTQDGAQ